ncbi:MAG: hypothetical protein U0793_33690 [Gemmataceae bacterium]
MSSEPKSETPAAVDAIARQVGDPHAGTLEGFDAKGGEGYSENFVDQIEMIGEETAAGFKHAPEAISPMPISIAAGRSIDW